jgi:hypothetical protein
MGFRFPAIVYYGTIATENRLSKCSGRPLESVTKQLDQLIGKRGEIL